MLIIAGYIQALVEFHMKDNFHLKFWTANKFERNKTNLAKQVFWKSKKNDYENDLLC